MKKVLLILVVLTLFVLAACSPAVEQAIEEEETVEQTGDTSIAGDTNNNGVADIEVEANEDGVEEVTIDFDDVQDEATQEALADAQGVEDYCVPGETFTYESEDGNVDANIVGLTTYKGSEFCEATSVTEIESPVGTITTDTTYYFDNTFKEYWIVVTTSSPMMPEPQTNEIHIVDGEVQQ